MKLLDRTFHARWCIYEFCGIKLKIITKHRHIDTINLLMDENYGIGNRIFAIINAIKFYAPDKINVYWAKEGWVSESMKSLFDLDIEIDEYDSLEKISKKNSRKERTIKFPQASLITEDGIERSIFKGNIDKDVIKIYKELFKKIKPSKEVKKRMESICLPEKYVALQVRNAKDWDDYGRNENLDKFVEQIKSYPEDTIFFLSAMNRESADYIKNNVVHKILELPNKDFNSMFDACADLYILSNAQEGIYSYGSTFGELAWWLSPIIQKSKIIGSDKNWRY